MKNINKAFIAGNLTRDAELRQTASGTSVLTFTLAVNDNKKNGDSWEEYVNYIDCVIIGSRAEKLSAYLKKGCKAFVEGKLRWSQWERDGQKRSRVEIVVDQVEFTAKKETQPEQQADSYYDSDIPF